MSLDRQNLKGLQTQTWSGKSRSCATVTPMALDRWPKKESPENIFRKHLTNLEPKESESFDVGIVNFRNPIRSR